MKVNCTWSGGGDSQLERQQVYTDKWTEVGNGREGRRGAAGASEGIYTPDFAFLQSACFHSSATPSRHAHIALKRHKALPSAFTRHKYPEFVSVCLYPQQ